MPTPVRGRTVQQSYADLSKQERAERRKAQRSQFLEQAHPFYKQEKAICRHVRAIVRDDARTKAVRIDELEQLAYDIAKQADDLRETLTADERYDLVLKQRARLFRPHLADPSPSEQRADTFRLLSGEGS